MMSTMTDNQADSQSGRERGFRRAAAMTVGLAAAGVAASLVVTGVAAAATARTRAGDSGTAPQTGNDTTGTTTNGDRTGTTNNTGTNSQVQPWWPPLTGGGGQPHAHSGGS
jgi:hypothetical protein